MLTGDWDGDGTDTLGVRRPAVPGLPPGADVRHGGTYWAVDLAVAYTSDDPEIEAAIQSLDELGYAGGVSGIDCDQGARETLGLDPDREYYSVAAYFETRAHAQQFVDVYEPGVVGTAQITAYCLD